MLYHAVAMLLHALYALCACLGHAAHTAPVRTPVHRAPAPMGPGQALATLLHVVQAHHGHVAQVGRYGYGANGRHTALNGGVWVQVGPGRCVGYETYGHPGFFGNVYGFTGGDCS